MNSIETQSLKAECDDRARCLRGISPIPEGATDPVAQFSSAVSQAQVQSYCTYDALSIRRDGERHPFLLFPGLRMRGDPTLGHSVLVRVRNRKRSVCDFTRTCEALYSWSVLGAKWP